MKIELKDGCFGSNLFVDGKKWEQYSTKEQKNIFDIIIDKLPNEYRSLEDILRVLVSTYGYTAYAENNWDQYELLNYETTLEL